MCDFYRYRFRIESIFYTFASSGKIYTAYSQLEHLCGILPITHSTYRPNTPTRRIVNGRQKAKIAESQPDSVSLRLE